MNDYELALKVNTLETEVKEVKADLRDLKTDVRNMTKALWGGFSLLFIGFISALSILVSQGGLH